MSLVAVCKVLDEADIVEAFARHTAHYVAHQIFVDNGSVDGTVEILQALRREGVSLTVLQNGARWFTEATYNTLLYRRAVDEHDADWVAFLDPDEFIDDRNAPLLGELESVPASIPCARITMTNYHPTDADDYRQTIVPLRIQWVEQQINVPKVMIRAHPRNRDVFVENGAHAAWMDGEICGCHDISALKLAHYPERSAFQVLVKFTRGWARVLATGAVPPTATHYASRFELLRDHPEELLLGDWIRKFQRQPADMEHDPITYHGGPLRYTEPQDEVARGVRAMVNYLEGLAREHGRLLDECPGALEMVRQWAFVLDDVSAGTRQKEDFLRVAAIHPHWTGFLQLSKTENLAFHESHGSKATYALAGDRLIMHWEKFASETFLKHGDTYVHDSMSVPGHSTTEGDLAMPGTIEPSPFRTAGQHQ